MADRALRAFQTQTSRDTFYVQLVRGLKLGKEDNEMVRLFFFPFFLSFFCFSSGVGVWVRIILCMWILRRFLG